MNNPNDPKNPNSQNRNEQGMNQSGSMLERLEPQHFQQMLQNQGRARVGGEEFEIKNATDPQIRELANAREIKSKPMGGSSGNDECQYELSSTGKEPVKVTVCRK